MVHQNNIQNKDKDEILQEFETSMATQSAQSHGLFSYHAKVSHAKEYVISDYTAEIRRQLGTLVSPLDSKGFVWSQMGGVEDQYGQRYYGFVGLDAESHRLHYQFDNETQMMRLYLDDQLINNVQLDLATRTTMELDLYAELWLLQHLKNAYKNKEVTQ